MLSLISNIQINRSHAELGNDKEEDILISWVDDKAINPTYKT